ncbi:MAG: hypothetical protein A2W09_03365 [Deltaproteobacteria bacterium RBG_16_50_11]|nr:MAG: hypothetical protein A2W09_03365 [Deltaproteobacteria bacterium RBG_16_50_11]
MLRARKLALDPIFSGKPIRLKEGVCRQLIEREWIFNRTENSMIFLIHKSGAYGIVVGAEDIDWNEN